MAREAHEEREAVDPQEQPEELALQTALRPQRFDEYVGQRDLLGNLKVFVAAARKRGEPLDHILFAGPPGLGKTTLAHVIANEMGAQLHTTSGPAIDHKGTLAQLLTSLHAGDVLFIDEIHRLSPVIEENLYPAMEDFRFDFVIGEGPHAKSVNLKIPPFTLLGATTRVGLLTGPLHNRFGFHAQLGYYDAAELTSIVTRSAGLLEVPTDAGAAAEIARRSRGTPRIANRLLRRVRDFADVESDGRVTTALAASALDRLLVDQAGLDRLDRVPVLARRALWRWPRGRRSAGRFHERRARNPRRSHRAVPLARGLHIAHLARSHRRRARVPTPRRAHVHRRCPRQRPDLAVLGSGLLRGLGAGAGGAGRGAARGSAGRGARGSAGRAARGIRAKAAADRVCSDDGSRGAPGAGWIQLVPVRVAARGAAAG